MKSILLSSFDNLMADSQESCQSLYNNLYETPNGF